MGFDVFDKINKAGQATEAYIRKRWEFRHVSEAERRRIEERNRFLALVAAKVTGSSMVEMPPLTCSYDAGLDPTNAATSNSNSSSGSKAVFLVTLPIAFGPFELSRSTYRLLARHLGMSLNSVSHWALCVIDRDPGGASFSYDLMSDQLALNALGRNYFRVAEVTPDFIESWTSCYYVGETMKSHEVIRQLEPSQTAVRRQGYQPADAKRGTVLTIAEDRTGPYGSEAKV
ncbi:hypothetical protein UCREL1_11770 [Eutypa lata UCREL1]|uniref:Uncharacterized protein n=1 Tax=Eutypa lata (strain UCR-EL1) TaxID=1287681 RepID=M7SAW2_EUTLA|nr:hypothetical protein UCREL1_11770 [Eutypa lata UCREL1]